MKLFLLLTLTACSCKKDVTIDLPEEVNKPVLNLLMSKDSLMVAQVTLASRIGQWKLPAPIRNAEVKLYENDVFKENMTLLDKDWVVFYKSTIKAQEGATYRIVASIPGYTEVEGRDMIPEPAKVGEVRLKVVTDNDGGTKGIVTVELHDKPREKNYYRIRIYALDTFDGIPVRMPMYLKSTEPHDVLFGGKERDTFFTDDVFFDGRSPRFSFVTSLRRNNPEKVVAEVTSLTYNSYNYLFSSFMAKEKNEDPLSEKVIVFNNILNGLGIVGGMTPQDHPALP